jgi:hypothetical protein
VPASKEIKNNWAAIKIGDNYLKIEIENSPVEGVEAVLSS